MNYLKLKYRNIKYKLDFLRVLFSPFKPLKLKWYFGETAIRLPYFYPRKWVKISEEEAIDKVKWRDTDYRFEWSPRWSFVFFKWQIAVIFIAPEESHYWECWLYYSRETKGTPEERIKQAREEFPCIWNTHKADKEYEVCYWDRILKEKYKLSKI